MKNALILQGWYQKPDSNWYPWLKVELEKRNYKVDIPTLPTIYTDLPDWKKMEKYIKDHCTVDKDTVIVGHSLGCPMALRMAEKMEYKKMILVSGWDFNDLTYQHRLFWKTPLDHKIIRMNVKEIICFGSDNDPYFTFFTVDEMSKRLGGKSILAKGAGHFTEEFGVTKVPQILKYII